MARPAVTPSGSRSEDRRMQPNRAAASFVPGQRSKFSNPSDLRGLSLTAGVFSSPHQRFAPDSSQQLSSFSAVKIKPSLGEHRSGGNYGPNAEGRVTFPSSRLAPSCHQNGWAVGSVRAGTRKSCRDPALATCVLVEKGRSQADRFGAAAGLQARPPVFRCTVVTMCPSLPLAILPGVVAELGRVS
jgi:hypothetical protein